MRHYSKLHFFEEAGRLRDQINSLQRIQDVTLLNKNFFSDYPTPCIPSSISKIEGYDISNIQGKFATGSMVVFENGYPNKNEYRKFKIRTKISSDDTAMLKEILERRSKHIEWPFPDLVLVDGGKAQLNTAYSTIKNLQLTTGEIALTKDEKHRGSKIYISERRSASWRIISLSKLSTDVKNLLIRIDSEAHRFAITYYRHGHRKALI